MSTILKALAANFILFFILFPGSDYALPSNSLLLKELRGGAETANSSGTDVSYTIEPYYDLDKFYLNVQMEFKGEQSGATRLLLPSVNGYQIQNENITSVNAVSENTIIENSTLPNVKIVKYIPFTRVRISYRISEIRKWRSEPANQYKAVIQKNLVNFLGETFFIIPNWNGEQKLNIKIEWKHLPPNWNIANSFGVNQKIQEVKISITELMHSIFSAGDIKIIKRYVSGSPIYFSLGSSWNFSIDDFVNLSVDILKTEREFWRDNDYPFFLISVQQIENGAIQNAISSINSLGIYLSGDCEINYNLKRLLAHEMFHHWIGDRMNFSDPEQLLYWFKEGFSEYYSRLLLLRAKLITLQEYADSYNSVLDEYFTSSLRNEKNEALADDIPDDPDLSLIPYLRGDIIAHNLNFIIRKNSNWTKSLDDLMRDLYGRCINENLMVSNGSLSALIRYFAGEQTLNEIMRVLNSGAVLKTNPTALGPCFKMQTDSHRRFWLIGEKYEVPRYEIINDGKKAEKKCLDWFSVN